jgi:hypothetical protein
MLIRMFTALMLLVASLSINAAPIVYTLYDVNFANGSGSATGTFTYDSGNITIVEIITTDNGSAPFGETYRCVAERSNYCAVSTPETLPSDFGVSSDGSLSNGNVLVFDIVGAFGDLADGGTFELELTTYEYFKSQGKGLRYVAEGGYISSLPPEAVTLEEQLEALSALIVETNANAGISNALDSKLNRVFAALDDTNENNDGAALNSMYAFCSSIDAQRGKKLTEEQAKQLIEAGNGIISSLDEFAPLCE